MPDEPRPSLIQRILASTRRRRTVFLSGAALFVAVVGATTYVLTPGSVSANGAVQRAGDPSPETRYGVTDPAAEARAATEIARFIEEASKPSPTFTPVPPTSTATPVPTPTPAPPAVRQQQAPPAARPTEPAAPAEPQAPWGLDTSPMDPYAQALFYDTNRRRVESGLPELRVNGWLIGIARIRAQDMADHNYFAHESPITGDTAFSLMDKHGVPYGWAGENLAKNNYPDSETVSVADTALWNSPPHRENILNQNFTDMGIAFAADPTGMKYFAIIFTGPP